MKEITPLPPMVILGCFWKIMTHVLTHVFHSWMLQDIHQESSACFPLRLDAIRIAMGNLCYNFSVYLILTFYQNEERNL